MFSLAPLVPDWKIISAPVVPAPDVGRRVNEDVVEEPPICKGDMMLVSA